MFQGIVELREQDSHRYCVRGLATFIHCTWLRIFTCIARVSLVVHVMRNLDSYSQTLESKVTKMDLCCTIQVVYVRKSPCVNTYCETIQVVICM